MFSIIIIIIITLLLLLLLLLVLFLLENVSNLTHEYLSDNFKKKIYGNFLVKIVIQKPMYEICCIFKENCSFYFLKTRSWEAKVLLGVKTYYYSSAYMKYKKRHIKILWFIKELLEISLCCTFLKRLDIIWLNH